MREVGQRGGIVLDNQEKTACQAPAHRCICMYMDAPVATPHPTCPQRPAPTLRTCNLLPLLLLLQLAQRPDGGAQRALPMMCYRRRTKVWQRCG